MTRAIGIPVGCMVSLSFDQVHRMNKMLVYLFGALAGGVIESVSDALLFVLMSCLFVASIRFTHEFVTDCC